MPAIEEAALAAVASHNTSRKDNQAISTTIIEVKAPVLIKSMKNL
jgi:hypothetical protein